MERQGRTFRKLAFTASSSLAGAGVFLAFVVGAFSDPNGSVIFGAFVISLFMYFFWLIGWHSAVRIDGQGIRVDNFMVRHYIPWGELTRHRRREWAGV